MTANLPILAVPMLMVLMLTLGLWTEQLGGGDLWRVPMAMLVGLAVGLLLANAGIALPAMRWLVPGAVIVVGVLVALHVTEPAGLGPAVALVAAAIHGRRFLAMPLDAVERIVGAGAAAMITLAIGIGVGAMLGRGLSPRLVRGLGAVAALWAAAVAFAVI
jgi:hydrogenase/urease accessory protein HupE